MISSRETVRECCTSKTISSSTSRPLSSEETFPLLNLLASHLVVQHLLSIGANVKGHRFGRQNCSWLGLLIRVMSKSLVLSSKQDLISGSSTTATRIPSSWPLWEVSSASSGLLISKGGNRHQSRGFDGSKRPSSLLVRRQREELSSSSSLLCVASTSITVTKTASHLSSGASFNGRSTVADLLLSHGSDHSIKDLNGQDVLKMVCSSDQRETSQVILNHRGRHQLSRASKGQLLS